MIHFFSPLNTQGIIHGFCTRQGGVSPHPYDSLNVCLSSGDTPQNVTKNKELICARLGIEITQLVMCQQQHGNKVRCITPPFLSDISSDALVTGTAGFCLGVMTADCVPILCHDPINHVIGAIHAGWRGVTSEVVFKTIEHMQTLGANPSYIHAAIGPCIWPESYEVGEDVFSCFSQTDKNFLIPHPPQQKEKKWTCDLPKLVTNQLMHMGVLSITPSPFNTYAHEDLFFSCRRNHHKKIKEFGDQLSFIMLTSR